MPPPRLCECGCLSPVARRFLPGHDARLKAHLLQLAEAGSETAARRLLALGWAHYLPQSTLEAVPIRYGSTPAHLTRSVHIDSLRFIVLDDASPTIAHSRWFCPRATSTQDLDYGRFQRLPHPGAPFDPWPCGLCIHTHSFAELARDQQAYARALAGVSTGMTAPYENDPVLPFASRLSPSFTTPRSLPALTPAQLALLAASPPDPAIPPSIFCLEDLP